ncbi:MAG: 50S ribosomal protein L9 [Armatimonadetes bacterium]|nr:50S ribosomal protein L9 [Armatimonadota bacterium]MBS1701493.1 50S ribosomal protein L9 [Armatimonadota bacterium]MBS1725454.1 50S ribosomal protein L9 [Armatimonadota bacterium]
MKVILNQTVPKVGKAGTVVNVADGFARNYLFPRGLAIYADKSQIAALEKRNARLAEKVAAKKTDAEGLKTKLDGQTVKIETKVGADGVRLNGAITSQNIADAIKAQLGVELDKKQVALHDPIKRLGSYSVELDLHAHVDGHITVDVFDPALNVVEETEEEEESAPVEA